MNLYLHLSILKRFRFRILKRFARVKQNDYTNKRFAFLF